ncbi:hypothetical protein FQZ97_850020 [compost metagenome]
MLQAHHAVHVRVLRQQFAADALNREVENPRHALHGGGDGEQVARAQAAVGVAVALEGVAGQWRQLGRRVGGGQAFKRTRRRHHQPLLVDPSSRRDGYAGVADDHVVASHGGARGQVHQRHLVPLGHSLDQHRTVGQRGARLQATVVDDDGHVVGRVHADAAGGGRG